MPLAEFISAVGDNQFFKAGFGLASLGVAAGVLRKGFQYGSIGFRRWCTVSMEVPSTDISYQWLLRWLTSRSTNTQHLSLQTDFDEVESSANNLKTTYKFIPAIGEHYFWYGRRLVRIDRQRETRAMVRDLSRPWESVTLNALGRDRKFFTEILEYARTMALAELAGKTVIFKPLGPDWKMFGRPRRRRPINSVVLSSGKSERILADARDFINNPKWYADRGIPYRRGYLLYGPAGCGKSSFITALAGELDFSICVLSLGDPSLSNDRLDTLLSNAPPRSIVLLEDIDAAFPNRETNEFVKTAYQGMTHVTFSGLLNALDGVASSEGTLIFMTTNYIERLDAALIRPGRVDVKEEISFCSSDQLEDMFTRFYPDEPAAVARAFSEKVVNSKLVISPAQVQGHFMLHKDEPQAAIDNIFTIADFCTAGQLQQLFKQFYPNEPTSRAEEFGKRVAASRQAVTQTQVRLFLMKHEGQPQAAMDEIRTIVDF